MKFCWCKIWVITMSKSAKYLVWWVYWMKNKCLLLSTFCSFQTPSTLLTNCALSLWRKVVAVSTAASQPYVALGSLCCKVSNSHFIGAAGCMRHILFARYFHPALLLQKTPMLIGCRLVDWRALCVLASDSHKTWFLLSTQDNNNYL